MKIQLKTSYIFLFLSIISQSSASLLSKYAADTIGNNTNFILLATNLYYIASLACLVLQALFWQFTLKELELSIAYPITALNNIIILLFSYFLFNEEINLNNIIGVCIIILGIIILNLKRETK
ncbi:EamA family transporter [Paenibacillus favisporus]|uniref:EamA family transporter n=1 Tax=Paenibacillus favisporus TaxID=221028 RepID=UPI003D2E8E51